MRSQLGDVATTSVLRAHEGRVRSQAETHGGRLVKTLGDGTLLAFGSPAAAVNCAIAIQNEQIQLDASRKQPALSIRIGMTVGEVAQEGGDVHGQAVHAAARITSRAKGGEILVSEAVRQLAAPSPDLEYVDRGRVVLRGMPGRWRLFALKWTPPPIPSGRLWKGVQTVSLVGRGREMREIERLLERAAVGAGDVLVFVGVPGVGKTVVLEAAADMARARGFEVLRGSPASGQPGRLVWGQLLRDAGAPDSVSDILLGDPSPLDLDRAALELTASPRRVIVVDDLDRGGEEAIAPLSVMAARLAAASAALIAGSSRPLGTGREIRVGPLSEDELDAVVGPATPETRHALWVACGGLPGPARTLAGELSELPQHDDALVHVALHAPSRAWFLGVDVNLVRLLETAIARTQDDRARARLQARLARELLGDASAAKRRRELVDEALRMARRIGDERCLSEVLDARLGALWDPAGAEDRLATGSEIIELARATGDGIRERHGMFWRFVALMELGRVAEAESTLAVFGQEAAVAGDAEAAVMVKARYAMLAVLRGRFDEAVRLGAESIEEGRRIRLPDADNVGGSILGMVSRERGNRTDAYAAVELMLRIAREAPGHFHDATAAHILASLGELADAEAELERVLPRLLVGSGPRWLGAMANLAFVAAATGNIDAAAKLMEALVPYRGRLVVFAGGVITMEPVSHYLGLLANASGSADEAVTYLEEAISLEAEIGALPHMAYSLDALADALTNRGAVGDEVAASHARARARSIAERLGMTVFLAQRSPAVDEWRLSRDGDDWVLDAGHEHARLRDGRGLHYLRALLAAPGQDIPALDLAAGGGGLATSGGSTAVLDDAARREYRTRLSELDAELDRADRAGDPARAERAEMERQALVAELGRASGLGGRTRPLPQEDERARVNVTRTLRATLDRIAERAPIAAAHLQTSIRTGRTCRYQPGTGGPTRWSV
jgi:tetratricopeptide (TPR) repeat protein